MEKFKVEIKDENGGVVGYELAISKLTPKIKLEGDIHYNNAFSEAIVNKLFLRCQINSMLEERGVFDSKAVKVKTQKLRSELRSLEVQLKSARKEGRKMTKSEGREIALRMRETRKELMNIGGDITRYYNNTVESVSDNERLNYFVYALTVHADTGKNYWKSYDEFKSDDSPVKSSAVDAFIKSFYGNDIDAEKDLSENAWLIRHKFMDEKLRLLDEKGRVINSNGHLINDDERLINADGQLVDEFDNLIDDNGNLLAADGWEETEVLINPVYMESSSSKSYGSFEPLANPISLNLEKEINSSHQE